MTALAQQPDLSDRHYYLLGQVTAGVLHDLGSLVNGVLSNVQLALISLATQDADHVAESLRTAEQAARAIDELRAGLLTFARGEHEPRAELLELGMFVQGVAPLLRRLLGPNIAVLVELAPAACFTMAVPSHLTRVLLNLALNARDAIAERGTITIATRCDEVAVILSVADDGCGMLPEVLSRLFEPFFTTKGAHGTGLGLVACQQLVEAMGGEIRVASELGQGTTVEV